MLTSSSKITGGATLAAIVEILKKTLDANCYIFIDAEGNLSTASRGTPIDAATQIYGFVSYRSESARGDLNDSIESYAEEVYEDYLKVTTKKAPATFSCDGFHDEDPGTSLPMDDIASACEDAFEIEESDDKGDEKIIDGASIVVATIELVHTATDTRDGYLLNETKREFFSGKDADGSLHFWMASNGDPVIANGDPYEFARFLEAMAGEELDGDEDFRERIKTGAEIILDYLTDEMANEDEIAWWRQHVDSAIEAYPPEENAD